jgi:hypothetical protein
MLVKASIYANKNLCYHLDERYKRSEYGYSMPTDTSAWANNIKTFVEYKLDRFIRGVKTLGDPHVHSTEYGNYENGTMAILRRPFGRLPLSPLEYLIG